MPPWCADLHTGTHLAPEALAPGHTACPPGMPIRAHPPVAEVPEPSRDARPGPTTTTTFAPVALDTGGGPSTAVRTADEVSPKAPKSCGSASEPAVSSGYTKVEGTVVSAVTAASVLYPLACSWVLSTAAMPFTLVPFATKIRTDRAVGPVDVEAGEPVDGAVEPGAVELDQARWASCAADADEARCSVARAATPATGWDDPAAVLAVADGSSTTPTATATATSTSPRTLTTGSWSP